MIAASQRERGAVAGWWTANQRATTVALNIGCARLTCAQQPGMALVVSCGHDDVVVSVSAVDDGRELFRLDLASRFTHLNGCDISCDSKMIAVAGRSSFDATRMRMPCSGGTVAGAGGGRGGADDGA